MSPRRQTQPLSITPSQSSSTSLQVSVTGPTEPVQGPYWPFTQVCFPATQAPVSVPQAICVPSRQLQPSSTTPLQFSSPPLQSSGIGPTPPAQAPQLPAAQVWVPGRQSPTLLPQGRVSASSTRPLQSSSALLQVSAPGRVWPVHAPQLATPFVITQLCVPARQTPTPAVP